MRTAAVLPVKRFAEAKQRLARTLPPPARAALVEAMLNDVLAALADSGSFALTVVVSAEPAAVAAAAAHGALLVHDGTESGQSDAALLGIERALQEGAKRVLCVPGDCPALDPAELRALLAAGAAGEPEVVILPDRHGSGTNGLLLTPPAAIAPSFGPDSRARHERLALAAGASVRVEPLPSLLLDIYTGADLEELRGRLADLHPRARLTRAALAGDAHALTAGRG